MINSVHFKAFRSLEDTGEISLKRLTVLVGKNSIGKSSFLRSFPLFQQSLLNYRTEPVLWYTPGLVDFGSYQDTKQFRTTQDSPLTFSFKLDISTENVNRRHFSSLYRTLRILNRKQKNDQDQSDEVTLLKKKLFDLFHHQMKNSVSVQLELNLYKDFANYVIYAFDSKIEIHYEYQESKNKLNSLSINGIKYGEINISEIRKGQIIPDIVFNGIVERNISFFDDSSTEFARKLISKKINNNIKLNNRDMHKGKGDFLFNQEMLTKFDKKTFLIFSNLLSSMGESYIKNESENMSLEEYFESTFDRTSESVGIITELSDELKRRSIQQSLLARTMDEETLYSLILLANTGFLVSLINNEFDLFFSHMSYSTPVRANAERNYRNQSLSVNQVDPNGENVPTILLNLKQNKKSKYSEWQEWTKSSLNIVFDINNENNFSSISVKSANDQDFHNLTDTGFGYSQILPIILSIWLTIENTQDSKKISSNYSLLEQPELHLHPAMQALLMNTLDHALSKNNNMNLMIETHSEYMIKQLGIDIANKILSPDDVQVLVFNEEHGIAEITTANFLKNGTLENWPLGFFQPDYFFESEK